MKGVLSIFAVISFMTVSIFHDVYAQISGIKNIPGDYTTLANAIGDLNTLGVGPGGVTLNLLSGNPQTTPSGGYNITTLTSSLSNQIIIEGNSNIITAFTPQSTGALNDAVFKIIGSDYVTIRNFIVQENAANTDTNTTLSKRVNKIITIEI